MDKIEEILHYWFGDMKDDQTIDRQSPVVRKWFKGGPKVDAEILERFEEDLKNAGEGSYASWESSPRGRLALILLFDQFARNMYRGTPRMYATDSFALDMALRTIAEGQDQELQLIERVFVYMPLMHAEILPIQEKAVRCFERLVKASQEKSPQNTAVFQENLRYARHHHGLIAQFGRFPHRNSLLKRESTLLEREFLKENGKRT